MAVPKKKVSRSRRDRRRHASGNQLRPVSWVISPINQEPIRPHCVTLETVDAYIALRQQKKKN